MANSKWWAKHGDIGWMVDGDSGYMVVFDEEKDMWLRTEGVEAAKAAVTKPTDRRSANGEIVASYLRTPDPRLLDGFGCKRGKTWDQFQVELCNALERCNARKDPQPLTSEMVESCIKAAVGSG